MVKSKFLKSIILLKCQLKKALYFATLVFACNVSAQDIPSIIRRDQTELNQRNEALLSIDESQVKTITILIKEVEAMYNTVRHNVLFSPIQLVDSIYYWRWDLESSTWEVVKKRIDIIYNESNAYTSTTDQYWNGSQWINSDLYNYKFDGRDNLTQFSIYTWDISSWRKFLRILSVFDIHNNRTLATNQQGINNQWDNLNRSIMAYDEHNNLTQRNTQIWQALNWIDQYQYFYTYDSSNNVTNFIGQDWDGIGWIDSRQKTYMYDAYDNEILVLNQIWNGNGKTANKPLIHTTIIETG